MIINDSSGIGITINPFKNYAPLADIDKMTLAQKERPPRGGLFETHVGVFIMQ
jgi:hypothetical protein